MSLEADLVRHDEKARLAQAIIDSRRGRQRHLPETLFGEYAWDALLHLFVADAASQRLTGHSLVKRIGCAPQVMTRWLMYLSQAGLVVGDGNGDLSDLLTMAPPALDAVEAYLAETQELARQYFGAL
jgi:hypothetical protein